MALSPTAEAKETLGARTWAFPVNTWDDLVRATAAAPHRPRALLIRPGDGRPHPTPFDRSQMQ